MPPFLEQERNAEIRVEREQRGVRERRLDGQALVQKVCETLHDAEVQVDASREHVAPFDRETDFHVGRDERIGALGGVVGDDTAFSFGAEFRIAHQLEPEVQTRRREEVVLLERVAEHDRELK